MSDGEQRVGDGEKHVSDGGTSAAIAEKLLSLKKLYDAGILTDEEYEVRRKALVKKLK